MKNNIEKMLEITMFARRGMLNGKSFEPQPFFDALYELEAQFEDFNFQEIRENVKNHEIQKRAKSFILWYRKFVKTNPWDQEKFDNDLWDLDKPWEVFDHIKECMSWQLIAKEEFKVALADCYALCRSQTNSARELTQ